MGCDTLRKENSPVADDRKHLFCHTYACHVRWKPLGYDTLRKESSPVVDRRKRFLYYPYACHVRWKPVGYDTLRKRVFAPKQTFGGDFIDALKNNMV